jgi:hypothetical protein
MLRALELCSGGKKASDSGTLEEHLPQSKDRPDAAHSTSVAAPAVCMLPFDLSSIQKQISCLCTPFAHT